ncbi:MAG: DUF4238 domain-containing protein [Rhodoglobus sp.]
MTDTSAEGGNALPSRFKPSTSGTRRGHMVTGGYIRAWADGNNVVDVIDVQDGRGYPSSYKNASIVSYVYDSAVLTLDLEREYGAIESQGISAFSKLRAGKGLDEESTQAAIAFLDMHLHRGRYADRAGVRVPALLLMTDGTTQEKELLLGDMLPLAHQHPDSLRLTSLELENWTWQIFTTDCLYTGDGAVMLWRPDADHDLATVTFPLSPTQLLVIGDDIPPDFDINRAIANNCRRWLLGQRGTLPIEQMKRILAQRAVRPNED